MIGWAVSFLIIALMAVVVGFGGIGSAAMGMAQTRCVIFLVAVVGRGSGARIETPVLPRGKTRLAAGSSILQDLRSISKG
jgi:uncharacterized membrane protein YtjA (UPF0391 family)